MTTQTTGTQTDRSAHLDFDALARELSGEVLLPGDEGFEEARELHDTSFDRWPAAIVRVADSRDVATSIRFARDHEVPLAVRSGGHNIVGLSVLDGALVIDLARLKSIEVDPVTRTARVQPGVISAELAAAAAAHGLALTTGDTSTVGIGGLTIGGGVGFMVRKYGLTIDNLLSAEVVTVDGETVRASANEHPELFWAIRGGGGNFGVVTEFKFRLAPVREVLGGMIFVPATREAVRGYLEYAPDAPEDLTTLAHIMHAPPAPFIPEARIGELVLGIIVCWMGDPEEGRRALEPLYALGPIVADAVDVMPYPALYQFTEEGAAARHIAEVRSMFSADLSDAAIDALIEGVDQATAPMSMVQLRGLGGALARVAPDATAFAHRSARVMTLIVSIWHDTTEDDAPHRAWTRALFERVRDEREGVYVNFVANEGPGRIHEAYPGDTFERLARVKRTWDPENVFQGNQNVRPS